MGRAVTVEAALPAPAFTPAEVVEALYRGILDRFPDGDGLEHNLAALAEGTDLPGLVHGIRHSQEASSSFLRSPDMAAVGAHLWRASAQRRTEPLIYFCHIMKTGGTALVDAMVAAAGDRFCVAQIFLDHLVAMPRLVLERASLISGHLGLEAIELLPADTVTVTVLRDPLERTLSHYAHVLDDPALTSETAGLTLEEFLESSRWRPLSSNFQARSLIHRIGLSGAWVEYSPDEALTRLGAAAPRHPSLPLQALFDHSPLTISEPELRAAALDRLAEVDHVGVTERLDDLWAEVASRWGAPARPLPRANMSRIRVAADEVPASLREVILETNAVDLALYERAKEISTRRTPAPLTSLPPTGLYPPARPVQAAARPPATGATRARQAGASVLAAGHRHAPALFGVLICVLAAAVDALDGTRLILIGALAAGPCAVLATGRWRLTAGVGILAVGLAAVLGVPDGIWATGSHLALVGVVALVGVLAAVMAGTVGRRPSTRGKPQLPAPGTHNRLITDSEARGSGT